MTTDSTLKPANGPGEAVEQIISNVPRQTGPAQPDDLTLARAAREDARDFGLLYQRHFKRVYGYHFVRTGNIDDAQDLTSQTFMAALESLHRFRGEGSFLAWLMTIAHHKMAQHYRRRRPVVALDALEQVPNPAVPAEDEAVRKASLANIVEALQTLLPERAEALSLRTFGGLNTAETAQVLGKSEAAVKMMVYRALQDIRKEMDLDLPMEEK